VGSAREISLCRPGGRAPPPNSKREGWKRPWRRGPDGPLRRSKADEIPSGRAPPRAPARGPMDFTTLTIRTEPKKDPEAKTRTFSVQLLGFLTADPLWEPGGNGSAHRPVWIAYAGTDREAHPSPPTSAPAARPPPTATSWRSPNALPIAGPPRRSPADSSPSPTSPLSSTSIRWPKAPIPSALSSHRPAGGSASRQKLSLATSETTPGRRPGPPLFCAYLDRRTPLPLIHDLHFHLQVYRAAGSAGWLHELSRSRAGGEVLVGRGAEASGLDAPVACSVGQSALADFLIQQTQLFHHEEIRRGKTRIAASGRLLPYPLEAPVQLRLDLAVA
jgi:hypothetical protein